MRLSTLALNELFDRLGTPPAGRRLVEQARRNAPVRKVKSNSSNVITVYWSNKMGTSIEAESRGVEFPAIIAYEHDDDTLEYYAQPVWLDLKLTDGGTKPPFRLQHAPDFLVIKRDAFLLEEWRARARLERLASEFPRRYLEQEDGWHFPEAEEAVAELGITYRLRCGDEHNRRYVQNILFLEDYLAPGAPPVSPAALKAMRELFADRPAIALAELIELANPHGASPAPQGTQDTSDGAPHG